MSRPGQFSSAAEYTAVMQKNVWICNMCTCPHTFEHACLWMHDAEPNLWDQSGARWGQKYVDTIFFKPFLLLKYSLPNRDIAQTQEARSSIPAPPQYLKRCVTQLVVSFLCSLNIAAFSCFFVPYCLPTFLLSASSVSSQEHCRLGGTHCGYLWPPKIGTAVL